MDFSGAGSTTLDIIHLDAAVFAALPDGALSSEAFESGAGLTAAETDTGRIIYDTASGALYYDVDGAGGADAVQFAVLAPGVDQLNEADFVVI
jgi:Ca2+-binding RTX toxin-like protein